MIQGLLMWIGSGLKDSPEDGKSAAWIVETSGDESAKDEYQSCKDIITIRIILPDFPSCGLPDLTLKRSLPWNAAHL